jgi:hypothetical protein
MTPFSQLQQFCDRAEELAGKATPGPWKVEDYRDRGDWRSTGLIWSVDSDSGRPLKSVCRIETDRLHSESGAEKINEFEGNAALIEAAPTIIPQAVAVIRKALAALEQIEDLPPIHEHERRRIAREAIEAAAELVKEK